jgi:hypothetical protein
MNCGLSLSKPSRRTLRQAQGAHPRERKQPNTGSRAAVPEEERGTRFSSRSDDEVGGNQAPSALSERSE